MYKLIALDMDGTLLKKDNTISIETKEILNNARSKGIKIVLASGRPIEGLNRYLEELDLIRDDEYVLSYNGALVQNIKSKEIITGNVLSGKDLKDLQRISKELGVFIHAFSKKEGLIVDIMNEYTQIEANINGINITQKDFENIEDNEDMIKIMMIDSKENIDRVCECLPCNIKEKYTVVRSADIFLEFLNKNSNKGTGLKSLANHLGIKKDEIIAIGDAGNDIDMIKYAGLGVAMENAFLEVKEVSDYITTSNEDEGVAKVIKEFVL